MDDVLDFQIRPPLPGRGQGGFKWTPQRARPCSITSDVPHSPTTALSAKHTVPSRVQVTI